ncbi:HAMP domain-containing histidine kinase [Geoalkalibacter subterraneus]|uniref:Histidine kinase n=1 Tax=Geoalkalibacter subterraneus TaxID=483547 RepID=A0A0B5FDU8_9BACT|nr:HAMP domain-containing histidine kinase [Geoalkalibacter subterraneus]AJF05468.1 hypothetical protein GSUB_01170 [Geoalkalibacter subterraneus]
MIFGENLGSCHLFDEKKADFYKSRIDTQIVEFFDAVYKELRIPLTTILCLVQLLLQKPEISNEERKNLLKLLEKKGLDISNFSEETFDIVHSAFGFGPRLRIRNIDVGECFSNLKNIIKNQPKQYKINLDIKNKDTKISVDKRKINSILETIISKFIDENKDGVKINIEGKTSNNSYILEIYTNNRELNTKTKKVNDKEFFRYKIDPINGKKILPSIFVAKKFAESQFSDLTPFDDTDKKEGWRLKMPISIYI